MLRPIDSDALVERLKYCFYSDERVSIETVTGTFLTEYCSPTLDIEPVKHGYVIVHEGREDDYWEQCSVCGSKEANKDANYCPNCGAKMDGGKGDDHAEID